MPTKPNKIVITHGPAGHFRNEFSKRVDEFEIMPVW